MMKLGLVARADNSGLGMQTWEFYNHMAPFRTMVVDISKYNGNRQYYERYPDKNSTMFIKGFPTPNDIEVFLQGLDVVFVAESPYNYHLYQRARELGIKTAVQYNYEFFDWFKNPQYPKPDLLIAPSMWHFEDVNAWVNHENKNIGSNMGHIYLHCPVNRDVLKFREIRQARTFLHIAGRAASHDRNGTNTVIEASKLLESDAQILIHFQGEQGLGHQLTHTIEEYAEHLARHGDEEKVTIQKVEYDNYWDIYKEGDVLLLPRRYGGNCLPMNEALSVGMPVIMTEISPNRTFLPRDWLIPAEPIDKFEPRTVIDIYGAKPKHLAARIDKFYEMNEAEMLHNNVRANNIAQSIDWESYKWQYVDALEELCNQS